MMNNDNISIFEHFENLTKITVPIDTIEISIVYENECNQLIVNAICGDDISHCFTFGIYYHGHKMYTFVEDSAVKKFLEKNRPINIISLVDTTERIFNNYVQSILQDSNM